MNASSPPLNRPDVFVNMAMSADGKIATANRAITQFGSRRDHDHLLELRAQADAVMAGARTVDSESVTMGPGPIRFRRRRLERGLSEYNLRIIVTGNGSVNPEAEVFRHRFSPIIVLTSQKAPADARQALKKLADDVYVADDTTIDFHHAFRWLADRWKIRSLLCEGGGKLNAALFREGLVDRLHLTVCPYVFGGQEAPTILDGPLADRLSDAPRLRLKSMRRHKQEAFFVFHVTPPNSGSLDSDQCVS